MTRQLLFIKRLFLEGCTYAAKHDPISAGIAISMFQDTAEMLIWALIKLKDIHVKKDLNGFHANMNEITNAGHKLSYISELQDLNKARIGFKHYGNLPAIEEVQKHRDTVDKFLRLTFQQHFNIQFDEITLSDLIVDPEIRKYLKAAEDQIKNSNFYDAMKELTKAHSSMLERFEIYVPSIGHNFYSLEKKLNQNHDHRIELAFNDLSKYLNNLRETILVSLLRLSLADNLFLKKVLPKAFQTADKVWHFNRTRIEEYNLLECERVLMCIINGCIELETHTKYAGEEFDHELPESLDRFIE